MNATWREVESYFGRADKSVATGEEVVVIAAEHYIQNELWMSLAYYPKERENSIKGSSH